MARLKIPRYAKVVSKHALKVRRQVPKKKRFGGKKGTMKARQIIDNKYLSLKDCRESVEVYRRLKGSRTFKCKGTKALWGGTRFLLDCEAFVKKNSRKK